MKSLQNNLAERNPLTFEDAALAAHVLWLVSEKSALKFFRAVFSTPREAMRCLRDNALPPDDFWKSL